MCNKPDLSNYDIVGRGYMTTRQKKTCPPLVHKPTLALLKPDRVQRSPALAIPAACEPVHAVANSRHFADVWPLVERILKEADPRTSCVVLDIDATALIHLSDGEKQKRRSRSRSRSRRGSRGSRKRRDEEVATEGVRINANIRKIYTLALARRIQVHFVTARVEEGRRYTIHQLNGLGYDRFTSLSMCPSKYRTPLQVSKFKFETRNEIARVYCRNIVLNAGDQWTDVKRFARLDTFKACDAGPHSHYVLFQPKKDEPEVAWALKLPNRGYD